MAVCCASRSNGKVHKPAPSIAANNVLSGHAIADAPSAILFFQTNFKIFSTVNKMNGDNTSQQDSAFIN